MRLGWFKYLRSLLEEFLLYCIFSLWCFLVMYLIIMSMSLRKVIVLVFLGDMKLLDLINFDILVYEWECWKIIWFIIFVIGIDENVD